MLNAVRSCAADVAKLEDVVQRLSMRLDNAAMQETVYSVPAALFEKDLPDISSELQPLLEDAAERMAQQFQVDGNDFWSSFQEKLNRALDESLEETLGPRIEMLAGDLS
jgi:hypothetical protein